MKKEDKKRFMEIIGTLAEIYGRKTSKLMIMAYWQALADLSIKQVENAAVALLARQRFFPRPMEFREIIALEQPDSVDLGWSQADLVVQKIRRVGNRRTVSFDDPITQKLVDSAGGYLHLCRTMKESETKWWRKEFVARYTAMFESAEKKRVLERIEAPEKVKQLVGGIG